MTQTGYLILAISILVFLLALFIVTFVIYRRIPVPKGCEHMMANDERCEACHNANCHYSNKESEK